MARVRAFRAVRPSPEAAASVAALPYDVYGEEEARLAVQDCPLSFLNIDRAETQFPQGTDPYSDPVYRKADEMLREWLNKGIFIREDTPCCYLYALTMEDFTEIGFAVCSAIDDYLEGTVKRHENTRADKEEDRIRHVSTTSMQTGPIFLAYRDTEPLARKIREISARDPLYDFTADDGIRHRMWRVDDPEETAKITALFAEVPHTYIADGHHRAASAVKVGLKRRAAHPGYTGEEEFNYFLSVLFPISTLRILDYNRVVKDLNGRSEAAFLQELGQSFEVRKAEGTAPYRPREKGEFGMYLGGQWYVLTAKAEIRSDDPVKGLDVSLLQDHLLGPVLGIDDPKTDSRIDFVGGIRGLSELERRVRTDMRVAFSLYPTQMEELLRVADAGLLMPPKSTWFEPKLRSGLLLHEIER